MSLSARTYLMTLMALAGVAYAQSAINLEANNTFSASTLPLRNVLIEVRQIGMDNANDHALRLRGEASRGSQASGAELSIQGNSRQRTHTSDSQQQVLVLNGRPARIALRNSVPLRLVQTVFHNGDMVVAPGMVMLEAGTGFNAIPRWDGQDTVELAVSAAQGQGRYQTQTTSTSTTVVVHLGEWVTVAQSDRQSMGRLADGSDLGEMSQTRGTQVQVRVTAP